VKCWLRPLFAVAVFCVVSSVVSVTASGTVMDVSVPVAVAVAGSFVGTATGSFGLVVDVLVSIVSTVVQRNENTGIQLPSCTHRAESTNNKELLLGRVPIERARAWVMMCGETNRTDWYRCSAARICTGRDC